MAKEVAKVQSGGAVAAYDYGEFGGQGFDDRSREAISLPYLNILQPLSPQVADGTVEGAKAGQFFNSVTGDLDDNVTFIWCHAETKFVEWVPREKGGGIVGVHEPSSDIVAAAKQAGGARASRLHVGDNELIETRYVYGLILDEALEVKGFAVIAAKSTNLKPVKNWYTSMMMQPKGPPIFAYLTKLGTEKQKNDRGTWHQLTAKPLNGQWKTSMINPSSHRHVLEEAKNLAEMVRTGAAKVDYAAESAPATDTAPGDQAVPF